MKLYNTKDSDLLGDSTTYDKLMPNPINRRVSSFD